MAAAGPALPPRLPGLDRRHHRASPTAPVPRGASHSRHFRRGAEGTPTRWRAKPAQRSRARPAPGRFPFGMRNRSFISSGLE
ncbi:uncharacterized protein ACIBXB_008848 isoform 2-T2 [Morphnus guianensis]